MLHFNGMTWKNFHDVTFLSNGAIYSVAIKQDITVGVGQIDNKAVIIIGKRF